jgi:hypothetical protein
MGPWTSLQTGDVADWLATFFVGLFYPAFLPFKEDIAQFNSCVWSCRLTLNSPRTGDSVYQNPFMLEHR